MKAQMFKVSGWIGPTDARYLLHRYGKFLRMANFDIMHFHDEKFEPYGYTAIFVLAESHFAIHTFPERGCSYIELTSCNENKKAEFFKLAMNDFIQEPFHQKTEGNT